MIFYISGKELKSALKAIKQAEKNGFLYCMAILETIKCDELRSIELGYDDLLERGHPTDRHFNWGRGRGITRDYKFVNGKLIGIKSWNKGKEE